MNVSLDRVHGPIDRRSSLDPEVVGNPATWDWSQTPQPEGSYAASPIVASQEATQGEGSKKRKRQEGCVPEIVSTDRVCATLPEPTQEQLEIAAWESRLGYRKAKGPWYGVRDRAWAARWCL
jgi:hypothetical protein